MTWKNRMYAGIGEYLRSTGVDVVEIVSIEDDTYVYTYVDGDYDLEPGTDIFYKDSKGKRQIYQANVSFLEFIKNIP